MGTRGSAAACFVAALLAASPVESGIRVGRVCRRICACECKAGAHCPRKARVRAVRTCRTSCRLAYDICADVLLDALCDVAWLSNIGDCRSGRPNGLCDASRVSQGCAPTQTTVIPPTIPPTTTSTTTAPPTTTTIPGPSGTCRFSGAPCVTDAECTIDGSCAPEGDCRQACQTDADCTPQTFCFSAAIVGRICVGCGGNSNECPVAAPCGGDDCGVGAHPDCPVNGPGGTYCGIPDVCLP